MIGRDYDQRANLTSRFIKAPTRIVVIGEKIHKNASHTNIPDTPARIGPLSLSGRQAKSESPLPWRYAQQPNDLIALISFHFQIAVSSTTFTKPMQRNHTKRYWRATLVLRVGRMLKVERSWRLR